MIHILPINDIEEHEESTACKCKPKIVFESGEIIVVHNSFDRREYIERLTENICVN
jgi:hypothetical protein